MKQSENDGKKQQRAGLHTLSNNNNNLRLSAVTVISLVLFRNFSRLFFHFKIDTFGCRRNPKAQREIRNSRDSVQRSYFAFGKFE